MQWCNFDNTLCRYIILCARIEYNIIPSAERGGRRKGKKVCLGRVRALNNCSRFLLDQGRLSTRVAVARPRGPKLFNALGRLAFHSCSREYRKVRGEFNYHTITTSAAAVIRVVSPVRYPSSARQKVCAAS